VQKLLENETIERGTFNVGNPKETYSTLGLARLVCQVAQRDVPIIFKEMDRTEIRVRVPNINNAINTLGYEPKVDLLKGLQLTYEWFRKAR
jgi:nucleoside-diphosphate-sugar epimerase